jgi:alanine racemase
MSLYSRLTIDLDAIAANWRMLAEKVAPSECAAAVKADGYGLGLVPVSTALWNAGCRSFFVAHLDEGLALRNLLPEAWIYLLNGVPAGGEAEAYHAGIVPILHSLSGLDRMRQVSSPNAPANIALQIDTGMNRLGLEEAEIWQLRDNRQILQAFEIPLVMSHFVTSENPLHPLNRRQYERFCAALQLLPSTRASLANSSGIFLGSPYYFDMVRPGASLYGVNPLTGSPNPMQNVVKLEARVLQIHDVKAGETVGYGAIYMVERPTRIATISIGYADGLPRVLSNRGYVYAAEHYLPIAGRVSMDLTTIDISALPVGRLREGDFVEVIGPNRSLDQVAAEADTIAYEVLTGLGNRPTRVYETSVMASHSVKGVEICHS